MFVVLDYSEAAAAASAAPAYSRSLASSPARSTMAKQGENEKRGAFALGGIIISSAVSQRRERRRGRGEGEYNLDSTHTHSLAWKWAGRRADRLSVGG